MNLSLIVAMGHHNVIGINNRLPWHLPADLKQFKALTLGKSIIMGRNTYLSIGKPLPERRNIIISRNTEFKVFGCEIVTSLQHALALTAGEEEVMLIGGGQLFAAALPQATRLYLTLIDHDFAGDCFFPAWDATQWQEMSRTDYPADSANPYAFTCVSLQRTLKR